MLTISQLAAHAGVTVRAVRHYHAKGLLPEPDRDQSGYRRYGAQAVVELIRIRTLADAGVPLSRVKELLAAEPDEFTAAVEDIDRRLRADIRELQRHRRLISQLAAGDSLALPRSVVEYLDRLRALGVAESYLALERDAWIMIAAELPDMIDSFIEQKHQQLEDPDTARLYQLMSTALDGPEDDPRLVEIADIIERQLIAAIEAGEVLSPTTDDEFVALLDSAMQESTPVAQRLLAILHERGWRGWTRIERVHTDPIGQ